MITLPETIAPLVPDLVATRRHIHQCPELSGHETDTARLVADTLTALGLEVRAGVGGQGVVGTLRGASPGRTLALRADMDALPIHEESDAPYRSAHDGAMHACGHDGHTTVLLGAAQALAAHKDAFAGEARFLFQPAEEVGHGAKAMIADGALDGVDAIAALHAWPPLPVGQIGLRAGAMTASVDTFEIIVHGRGAHGAYPHLGADPIVAAAQIVLGLQAIVSREVDPVAPAVVSVTQVSAGTAPNVIPETARLAGTLRAHSREVRAAFPDQIQRVAGGIAAAHRCRCEVTIHSGNPPVLNDPALAALLADAAGNVLGPANVVTLPSASMGAEDFAEYLAYVPGVFFRLGIGSPEPLHSPRFNFNDDALAVGVEVMAAFALRYLAEE